MTKKNQPGCGCCRQSVSCCPSLIRGTPTTWQLEIDGQTFDYKRYLPSDTDEAADWTVDGMASCVWYNDEGATPASTLSLSIFGDTIVANNLQIYTIFDDGCDQGQGQSYALISFLTAASGSSDGPLYEAQRETPYDGQQLLTLFLSNAPDYPDWPTSIDLVPVDVVPCSDNFPCSEGIDTTICGACCSDFQASFVVVGSDTSAGSFTNGNLCGNCSALNTLSIICNIFGTGTSIFSYDDGFGNTLEGTASTCSWYGWADICDINDNSADYVECFPPGNEPWEEWEPGLCKYQLVVGAQVMHRDDTDECRWRVTVTLRAHADGSGEGSDVAGGAQANGCPRCGPSCGATWGAMAAEYDTGWIARASVPCTRTGMNPELVRQYSTVEKCAEKKGMSADLTRLPCRLGNWWPRLSVVGM